MLVGLAHMLENPKDHDHETVDGFMRQLRTSESATIHLAASTLKIPPASSRQEALAAIEKSLKSTIGKNRAGATSSSGGSSLLENIGHALSGLAEGTQFLWNPFHPSYIAYHGIKALIDAASKSGSGE